MLFSQKIGLSSTSKAIQLEGMDFDLLNGLWNIYSKEILLEIGDINNITEDSDAANYYCYRVWHDFLKDRVDNVPYHYSNTIKFLREYFYTSVWYKVYDLLDFTFQLIDTEEFQELFYLETEMVSKKFNDVLQREFSGYRVLNNCVAPISNQYEMKEIQDAVNSLDTFSSLKVCNTHLTSALQKLSDRQFPDYRNSIKESISAVEALAKLISGGQKDTLGSAIDKIKGSLKIHSSLEKAIKNIYGYTSDSDGIRHALTEEPNIEFEDAKFMLVSCSAFINYLLSKADKAGIKF